MHYKKIILISLLIVFLIEFMEHDILSESKKTSIAISNFSLYDIAKNLSEDTIELITILPFGVDAHNFEPTPKLMAKILSSDLVIYSGAGLEPWIDGFDFVNSELDMSKHMKLLKVKTHDHEHEGSCSHGAVDPHYWLDMQNMMKATVVIADELIKLSPENKDLYIKNRNSYLNMLQDLIAEYQDSMASCKKDTIIVNHNAFSYLSHSFGFNVEALSGLSPEAEPSAKDMTRLIAHIQEHNISTIFFESFVSDKAIKSVADELDIEVDVIQPLGNITHDEARKKLGYQDIMRINLQKISKALDCR